MATRCVLLGLFLLANSGLQAADMDSELALLKGSWEITAVIDNGEVIPQSAVKQKLVKDGLVTINGPIISLLNPLNGQRRELPFVVNPQANPKTIDLAGGQMVGSKGIYLCQGDTLLMCLAGPEMTTRPTDFGSRPGSQNLLMTLHKIPAPPAVVTVPTPTPPAPAGPAIGNRDEEYRRALIGTWGHQDDDKVEMTTFNPDGTYSSTRTWKGAFQKIFHDAVRSSGTWKIDDGIAIVRVNASTDSAYLNQVYSFRINSLTQTEIVYTDPDGKRRIEWRVR